MTQSHKDEELREHCQMMVKFMKDGSLVPFFGAGVNRSNRPLDTPFTIGGSYLPDADELSKSIAKQFKYPWTDLTSDSAEPAPDLLRVAWYASYKWGEGHLYEYLHGIFSGDYPWTDVHQFFAELPEKLAAKGYPNPNQIIITTNYDELLERAFKDKKEPYDLLSYVPLSESGDPMQVGKFRFTAHGEEPDLIIDPPTYRKMKFERPMIVKIHGAVDGESWERSNFVITEDDYIDYLARMNTNSHIPSTMLLKMKPKSFLFLGYSLADWNLRVFLHSIRATQRFKNKSWAIMKDPKPWDETYWQKHNVELWQMPLQEYIAALNEELKALPDNTGGSPT